MPELRRQWSEGVRSHTISKKVEKLTHRIVFLFMFMVLLSDQESKVNLRLKLQRLV